jgi:hypothetical protein
VHRALHHAREDEALRVGEEPGDDVDEQRLEQHHVQLAEVDATGRLDACDHDVGGVAEDAGADDGERHADDGEHEDGDHAPPFALHPAHEPTDDVAEVLRALDGHADAEAGAGVDRDALTRRRDLFLLALAALAVRRRAVPARSVGGHAASSARNCDSTISW